MDLKKYIKYLPSKEVLILIFLFTYNPYTKIDTSTKLGRWSSITLDYVKNIDPPICYIAVLTQVPRFIGNYNVHIIPIESRYMRLSRQYWESNFIPEHWFGLTLVGSLGIDALIHFRNIYTFKHQNRASRRNKRYRIPRLYERYYICMLYAYSLLSISATLSHCAEALYFKYFPRFFIILKGLLKTFNTSAATKSMLSSYLILSNAYTRFIRAHDKKPYFLRYHCGQFMSIDVMQYFVVNCYLFWIDTNRLPSNSLRRLTVGLYIYIFFVGIIIISIFHALLGTLPRTPVFHLSIISHAGANNDNEDNHVKW